jgi:hypothetical protein
MAEFLLLLVNYIGLGGGGGDAWHYSLKIKEGITNFIVVSYVFDFRLT